MNIRLNDWDFDITLTIKDEDGAPLDISTAVLADAILLLSRVTPPIVAKVGTPAFFTDGTDGVVVYTVQDGDFDIARDWFVCFAMNLPAGPKATSTALVVHVQPLGST